MTTEANTTAATKSAARQTKPKLPPLLPVEYCSPERAARLLGCEVEDIFHWAMVGAITLYVEFYRHDLHRARSDDVFVGKINLDIGLPSLKIQRNIIDDDADQPMYYDEFDLTPANENTFACIYTALRHGAGLCLMQPCDDMLDRKVNLHGLWAIKQYNIFQIKNIHSSKDEIRWDIAALNSSCKPSDEFKIGIDLYDVVIPNIVERLRVVHDDLQKIQLHMANGKIMSKVSDETDYLSSMANNEKETERKTSKQGTFIVALLKSCGLTDADLEGSIGELRLKIANKVPAIGDPKVDDNTLIDWLKKGGIKR